MISMRLSLPALAFVWLAPAVASAEAPTALDVDLGAGVKLTLILVPKGAFTQGSPPSEAGRSEDERAHPVTLSNDVYIGKYPVTRGQFARFVSATGYRTEAEKGTSGGSGWDGSALVQRRDFTWKSPGFAQTDEHPVTIVTYDDALAFTAWLTRTSGRAFTLPTEAQWEHAYRAGTTSAFYAAKTEGEALALGWLKPNAGNGTRPVGQKKPNALGLHDLAGNVNEWCLDWYAPYGLEPAVDPLATTPDASDKPRRVLRGGSWLKDTKSGRAAARYRNTPGTRNADNGFRVAAGTSAVAAALPNVPSTPPASSTPAPRADVPPAGGGGVPPIGYVFMAGCAGTIALCAWMIGTIFRNEEEDRGRRAAGALGGQLPPRAGRVLDRRAPAPRGRAGQLPLQRRQRGDARRPGARRGRAQRAVHLHRARAGGDARAPAHRHDQRALAAVTLLAAVALLAAPQLQRILDVLLRRRRAVPRLPLRVLTCPKRRDRPTSSSSLEVAPRLAARPHAARAPGSRARSFDASDASEGAPPELAARLGSGPVWLVRASAWLAHEGPIVFPPPSATGQALCALGAVRCDPRREEGAVERAWSAILARTGEISPRIEARSRRSPACISARAPRPISRRGSDRASR